MIMPNRATVLLILLLKKWIFCKQVVGKRNWNVTLCIKHNRFCVILRTLSIDNEMHDDEFRNPRRIGSRVSFSAGKTKVKQCVVLRQRRVLVLWRVALVMAFKNVRNLLLINHNDGFFDDDDFFLYDLYASKNLDFAYDSYAPFDLKELDESESFAEFRFGKLDIWILKEVLQIPNTITCSQRSVCDEKVFTCC